MKRWIVLAIFCITTLVFGIGAPHKEISNAPVPDVQTIGKKVSVNPDFGKIPLYFIANNGQVDKQARFYARTSRYTLWITPQGMIFDSIKKDKGRDVSRLTFLNSRQNPTIVPEKPSDYRVNFLKGNDRSGWHTQVPSSERVCYQNLYNNIDLKVYGVEKQIEYDWVVKLGGNPTDIRFHYQNIKKSFIDDTGNLVIKTAFGEWLHKKPVGYQVINGKREAVEIAYEKSRGRRHIFGFKVSPYNRNYELIIDPMVIACTSYLGGNDSDYIHGIVVDGSGSMIVAGYTDSSNFPVLNGWDETRAGNGDGFVTKFSPNGTSLVFSTFVGGSRGDSANSICLDAGGGIYIGGGTGSSDFPTLNAFQGTFQGEYDGDGFVCKMSSDGSGLIYSSFLGGSEVDGVDEIAVNTSGELYALGSTFSMDFPLLNPIQSTRSGYDDLFVTKVSASGSSLVYSTLLGGNGDDQSGGIAIDNTGCAYVTGSTNSVDFPTVNAFQPAFAGGFEDGFVSKISSDGSSLVYSTYLGGTEFEVLCDIKVDNTGAAYVTGFSGSSNYPTTPSAYQPTLLGGDAAVITKLSPSGSSLVFSTFLGGSSGAAANALALKNGSVYIAGRTSSYDFPLVEPFRDYIGDFIARLSPDGSTLEFSSFLSGAEVCDVEDMAVDDSGNLYLAGITTDFFTAYQGFQNTYGGGSFDGFVTKLVPSQYSRITVTSPNGGEYWTIGSTREITWTAPAITENVKIILYYYQDYDLCEITIAESAPNTGSYEWTVPNISCDRCLIAIQAPSFHIQSDMSDANFTITGPPSITLGIPNGGEQLYPGSQYPIVWGNGGIIGNVSIDYSIDGGNSWISIAENVPYNDYFWTVPDTPSTNCLVRVTDAASSVTDTSDAVFTITQPKTLIVTAPNGGESWEGNTSHVITWTYTGSIPNVKIEYSTTNGSSWNTIIDSTANSGSYNWTVPNSPSTNCLVRVSQVDGPLTDTSDAVFTLWVPTIPTAEREALISLYNSTNGDNWTKNTNWRKPGDPSQFNDPGTECSWYGVTVAADTAHVETITLCQNNLNGTLPDLTALTALWKLDLGINHLSGSIPSHLNSLTNLKELWLQSNDFTGLITDLGGLTQLEVLYLPGNSLTGTIPEWLNNLTALKNLNLGENQLTGSIPDLSASVPLEYFYLSNNQLTGTVPSWLNQCPYLINISLSHNQLTGMLPNLSNLKVLEYLSLGYNQLSGDISQLGAITGIRNLSLNHNNFSGSLPGTWLSSLTNLDWLVLSENQFSGNIPDLSALKKLKGLILTTNSLTGLIPSTIGSLTSLETLYLSENQLTGPIPSELGNLSALKYLYLSSNQLTDSFPTAITTLSSLQSLILSKNHLSGAIPTEMGNMTALTGFSLSGNQFMGDIPTSLLNLTNATYRDIGWNGLYTDNANLRNFLGLNEITTQTVPPTRLSTTVMTQNIIKVSWVPISYNSAGSGVYRVYYTTTPGSNYTLAGSTAAITDNSYNVTGLNSGTTYYFVVQTFTNANPYNENTLTSDYSEEVSGKTIDFRVISPNGGEVWEGGTNHEITWSDNNTGSNAAMGVYYSTDGGATWYLIHGFLGFSPGYCDWLVPNLPSTNCLIKIANSNGLLDTGDAVFTITEQRSLTVTSPNGGENWEANTGHAISWTTIGNIPNVKLEYSTTNGSSWNTITASTANGGSYNWTVPNTASTNCLVKVSDATGPASDQSNAVFTILAERTITVTAPNGGESWEGNTAHAITWTYTGNIPNIKIEYSTNNGSSWNTITVSTANSGSYNWTVPNTPFTTCLVKVSDVAGPAVDQSNVVFTILTERTVTVTAPNGGESWEGNTAHSITWTSTGDISNVKLEYSTNSGSSWNTITNSTANTGSYNWTVANTPSAACLVKVSDAAGSASDQSNAVFTILAERTLTVTAPNGGESWEGNTVYSITWNSTGAISSVMIEYSTTSGSSWNTITASTANGGSYNWTVPNSPSSTCLIKISDITGPASDQSNAVFSIVTPRTITVTSPNGGESWEGNTSYPITWTSTGDISNVKLEYSTTGGSSWNTITASTANSGSYNWTVPNTASTNCLVKVSDSGGPASDQSNAVFTILTERTVTVTTPNGGETWEGNTSHAITWTSTGDISNVKLEYSTNNGSSWNTIAASTANGGSYNWTVPNTASANCLVKVSDAAGPASDQSNAAFTIVAYRSITVTSPNGGESWEGNTSYPVTWTSTGSIANVMIEYSTTGGSSWNTITASTANTGSYNWTVPNTPSSTCLIKISDTTGPASDQSNAVFSIVTPRTITVTSPNGAENLLANTTYPITWTSTGAISSVMIEYSTTGGSSWNTVTASTSNTGSYNWTIPASGSTSCLVKVSDTSGPAYDQSNAVFTISNVTYCASSGTSQTRGYIARIQVGNLDNSSGSSAYSNFTSLIANLTAGSSTSITLTPSTTNNTEYWKIWIDYNRDGDFADSGENVYSGSGKTTKTGSFTVPTATTKGTGRMRVTMRYNNTPTYCDSFSYGEVEDYTVNIQ